MADPQHKPQQDAVELVRMAIEMASCEKTMRAAIGQVVSPFSLNENGFFILMLCHENLERPLPQTELAQTIGLSPAQLSHLVEQLRQEGLIEPQRDAKDRRRQFWVLTDEGKAKLSQVMLRLRETWHFHQLPVNPTALLEGLRRMVDVLRDSLAAEAATAKLPRSKVA